MIDMLNVNTTIKEINISGNPLVAPEVEAQLLEMSNRFRKIIVN
jgi:hypothetical protein